MVLYNNDFIKLLFPFELRSLGILHNISKYWFSLLMLTKTPFNYFLMARDNYYRSIFLEFSGVRLAEFLKQKSSYLFTKRYFNIISNQNNLYILFYYF